MLVSPVDFVAMRAGLVAATRAATGLGQNAVVMQNANEPIAQRPIRPFATLRLQSVGVPHGRLSRQHAGKFGDDVGKFIYSAQRSLTCVWDFFGDTPEDAYGLGAAMQMGLEIEAIYRPLRRAGLAVWRVDALTDLSTLLNTGYEGRAHLTVSLGYVAQVEIDVGIIETVRVTGVASDDNQPVEAFDITADL